MKRVKLSRQKREDRIRLLAAETLVAERSRDYVDVIQRVESLVSIVATSANYTTDRSKTSSHAMFKPGEFVEIYSIDNKEIQPALESKGQQRCSAYVCVVQQNEIGTDVCSTQSIVHFTID